MGFIASLKGNLAMRAHNRGDLVKAKALYKEAVDKGLMECKPMLAYSLLLIREGSYEEAMALLLKTQKAPDLTPDRKSQLFVDYAACCAKTGQLDKGVKLLERQHQHTPIGLTYQTLGYLYVEQLAQGKPVADESTVVMVPGPYEYSDPVPGEGLSVEEKQTILAAGAGASTKTVDPETDRIERVFNVKSIEDYIGRIDEMIERKRTGLGGNV